MKDDLDIRYFLMIMCTWVFHPWALHWRCQRSSRSVSQSICTYIRWVAQQMRSGNLFFPTDNCVQSTVFLPVYRWAAAAAAVCAADIVSKMLDCWLPRFIIQGNLEFGSLQGGLAQPIFTGSVDFLCEPIPPNLWIEDRCGLALPCSNLPGTCYGRPTVRGWASN